MTTTPPKKPPFRKGEWVTETSPSGRFISIAKLTKRRAGSWMGRFMVSCDDFVEDDSFRLSTARELRAESARLRKRADELNAAADAVEKAKGKR